MLRTVGVVLVALELGAGFGAASAESLAATGTTMEIELSVEVRQPSEAVVAHLSFEDMDPITLPLLQREDGLYGIRTEVARVNYRVVFEVVGTNSSTSDQHSLAELGLEFPAEVGPTTTLEKSQRAFSATTRGWGWLSLALGAAALSALAFWALGGRSEQSDDPGDDTSES